MKFKKTQDEFDGKLTSLSQKVGVSIIGILTALGTGLIIYTGVMAATYDVAQQENEYLTYEDVEADIITDSNTTDQSAQSTESSDVVVSTDVTDSSNETDKSEDTETESEISTPTDNSVAYCNNDGVNVRDERLPYYDLRVKTRSPSPFAWIPCFLTTHERLTDLAVVPREKPHTGAAAREQPRDSPVIER